MNEVSLLRQLKTSLIRNQIRTFLNESRLKIYVLAAAGILIWYGLYAFFDESITFLLHSRFQEFSDDLISIVFHLLFLSLIFMLTFSNGIISYISLFDSEEITFFRTSPLDPGNVFLYKLTETISFSSWAFLFLATPLIVAYGIVTDASLMYFFLSVFLFAGAVILPAALGSLITIILSRVMPKNRSKILYTVMLVLLPFVLWGLWSLISFELQADENTKEWFLQVVGNLRFSQHVFLPSSWIAEGFISFANGQWKEGLFFLLFLTANGLFITLIAYHCASALLPRAWQIRSEGKSITKKRRGKTIYGPFRQLLMNVNRYLFSFLEKDVITFLRNPAQWAQFLIFFGLLGVYFFNLRHLNYHVKSEWWRLMISFLNLGATCLTLASFTTRFIFPQLSLEGRRFWVVGMAPVKRRTLLLSKFAFSMFLTTLICVPLVSLSVSMLNLQGIYFILQIGSIVGACLGLSGLAVGLGAVFPQFSHEEPSKIVSSFGGTLNLVFSLGFVLILLICGATPVYLLQTGSLSMQSFTGKLMVSGFLLFGTVSVVLFTVVPILFGIKALNNLSI